MAEAHFLLLTFPAQGHINPAIQFAKRLARAGANVTFATTSRALKRMVKSSDFERLSYASFSDGYDGSNPMLDLTEYYELLKEVGPPSVSNLMSTFAEEGRPVTCVVYTNILSWAADVARDMSAEPLLLWIQPAAALASYYHYCHGYEDLLISGRKDPSFSVELPGLPLVTVTDLPSFFLPTNNYPFVLPYMKELFEVVERESSPRVLVNTFNALEGDLLRAMDKLEAFGVGPLIPLAFLDKREMSDKSFGGDLLESSGEYVEWLESKPVSSVVYVSFGSISVLPEHQMLEILDGLVGSCHPFLWVVRPAEDGAEAYTELWKKIRTAEDTKQGLVVPWCSQVEVLSHPAVGCFVSHCGWNSTLESLAVGVPVVGFPQWSDQPINIKMVESVWKTGVRPKVNDAGVLEGGELRRCLDLVMRREDGQVMKRNAVKWRELAREAAAEGGSSGKNIQALVDEMRKRAFEVRNVNNE